MNEMELYDRINEKKFLYFRIKTTLRNNITIPIDGPEPIPCRPVSEGTAAPYKLAEPLIWNLVGYRRPSHRKNRQPERR